MTNVCFVTSLPIHKQSPITNNSFIVCLHGYVKLTNIQKYAYTKKDKNSFPF